MTLEKIKELYKVIDDIDLQLESMEDEDQVNKLLDRQEKYEQMISDLRNAYVNSN